MQVLEGNRNNQQVNTFLDSMGRNSKNTQKIYATGLRYFDRFLNENDLTTKAIISLLTDGNVNVYELLDRFVSYLSKQKIAVPSIKLYMATVRSYLEFNDVSISSSKFKRRVKMPKFYPDAEQPLDISDIRELLQFCNNTRLKCYLLVLVSSGLRTIEAAALRLQDVDFTVSPTRITVRKEYSKTRRGRQVYISDEATNHLQKLLQYRKNKLRPEDLVFSIKEGIRIPRTIYNKMLMQFEKLQKTADKDQRKENSRRRKITLHSFRRTCFSIINDQVGSEYANWFLGHNHSVYWTHKEVERRNIYFKKCMPYLTILDYTKLDARSKNIEIALKEKDKAIQLLTRQMTEMQQTHQEMKEYRDEMRALLRNPKKLREMISQD
jgi:integrase